MQVSWCMQAHTRVVGGFGVGVGAVELDVEHAVGVVLCVRMATKLIKFCGIVGRWHTYGADG